MKNLCLFICFSGFLPALFAQPETEFAVRCPYPGEPDFDSTVVVTALSGLKLREQPSFRGRTIALMPFAQKVKLLTLPGFNEPGDHIGEFSPDSIYGSWLKIRYGKQVGYAFSAYLGSTIKKMTQDFYLLSTNDSWCNDDSYVSKSYHFYGIFPEKDSTCERRIVEPVFLVHWTALFGPSNYGTIKVRGRQPLFLIASRMPMPEGQIPVTNRRGYFSGNPAIGQPFIRETIASSPWIFEIKPFPLENDHLMQHTVLTHRHSGQTQSLIIEHFPPDQLIWEGDLDGDGVMDFIMSRFQDIEMTWYLFLSKGAPPGQLLREVSRYIFSGCC